MALAEYNVPFLADRTPFGDNEALYQQFVALAQTVRDLQVELVRAVNEDGHQALKTSIRNEKLTDGQTVLQARHNVKNDTTYQVQSGAVLYSHDSQTVEAGSTLIVETGGEAITLG